MVRVHFWTSLIFLPLCRHEGFSEVLDVALTEPAVRTFVGAESDLVLSAKNREDYESCKLVYITCKKH